MLDTRDEAILQSSQLILLSVTADTLMIAS
jgi:hypothetical protein